MTDTHASLCTFNTPDEKNDRLREPIRKRFVEYLDRAEMLKDYLNDESKKKQQEAVGANGTSKK
jgi:vacuolar protein-sorting-associated protein 4